MVKVFIKSVRHLLLLFVISLGFILIIASGGGGGGDDDDDDDVVNEWVGTWRLQSLGGQDFSSENITGIFDQFTLEEGRYDSNVCFEIYDNSGSYIGYDYTVSGSNLILFKSDYDTFSAWDTTTPGTDNYLTMSYSVSGSSMTLTCDSYVGEEDDFCETSEWIK